MRTLLATTALALTIAVPSVIAQQPAAPPAAALKLIQTSADVTAIVARLKAATPAQPLRSAPLFQSPPYAVNIEYRTAVANAAVHETEGELFYVIDGAATFVVGGQLVAPTRQNAANLQGTGITGGTTQKVAKGDFMWAAAGAPHWFSAIDGTITLMSLHLPAGSR